MAMLQAQIEIAVFISANIHKSSSHCDAALCRRDTVRLDGYPVQTAKVLANTRNGCADPRKRMRSLRVSARIPHECNTPDLNFLPFINATTLKNKLMYYQNH